MTDPTPSKQTKDPKDRRFGLASVATVISIATGLYTLYSIDGQQRLFQARVGVDLLSLDPSADGRNAVIRVQNTSDRLVDDVQVRVAIANPATEGVAQTLPEGSVTPGDAAEVTVGLPPIAMKLGSKIDLCVLAEGPLPLSRTVWRRHYEVGRFRPKPGGRPVCSYDMADVMKYDTLPPAMVAEQKAGCVMPDVADPNRDYVPAALTLNEAGKSQGWGVLFLVHCGF
jgi:hypothetical protein